MRESAEAKGRRYLVEGRLLVERVDAVGIAARCRGRGAVYELGHDGEAWSCSCPALGLCAHLVALQLVTVREVDDGIAPLAPLREAGSTPAERAAIVSGVPAGSDSRVFIVAPGRPV